MPRQASNAQPLNDEVLLKSELEYIVQTAFQANEDRARVSSFYLVAVGSLVAALLSTQLLTQNVAPGLIPWAFSALFFVLTLLGALTILQLARLRATWHDSLLAMNQIKDFAMKQNPELVEAFRWKTSTLPSKYKKGSVSYYQAVEVSLITGLMFGASAFFLQQVFPPVGILDWILSVLAGIGMVFLQLFVYKWALR